MALVGWLVWFTICGFGSRWVLESSVLSSTKISTEPRSWPIIGLRDQFEGLHLLMPMRRDKLTHESISHM